MCTNYVITRTKGIEKLVMQLGINADLLRYQNHAKPGSTISIITDTHHGYSAREAIWWLFLKQGDTGLKPHPDYFSVNTRYDKLPKRPEYKRSRCIIPATAFMESQNGKHPHLLKPADGRAIAFGGLYKEWTDKVTGECMTSASIITLPGHPALKNIHEKSTPLWLREEEYDRWLDKEVSDTELLKDCLTPRIVSPLNATPIDRVSNQNPAGGSFVVS